MNKGKVSFSTLIIISFILLLITTNSLISYIVFSNWKLSSDNIITKMEDDANLDISNKIETFVSVPLNINEVSHNLIENEVVDVYVKKEREVFFAGVLKSNSEVYSFSYGTENGEYYGARRNTKNEIEIMRSDAETDGNSTYYSTKKDLTSGEVVERLGKFDPRTRDWYKIAKEQAKPIFSPIYEHFVMNDLAITASYPIYNKEGVLTGVLGTHFTLSKINSYLEEITKDKMATAYIIEKNSGALIANSLGMPNFERISETKLNRLTIEEVGSQHIKDAYLRYKNNSGNDYIVNKEDEKFHISFTDYKNQGIDWVIITVIPESQLTSEIIRNIRFAFIFTICALIISILIYTNSTKIILKPIFNLITTTEEFSKGDLLQRAKVFRNDEIGKLANAFNIMAEELYMLINNLEEKVKERTKELENAIVALKRSEGDIRLLMDSTAEAIYGIDLNGNCTFCNASCLNILGYKHQDELIGKNMHRLIHYKYPDGTIFAIEECQIFNTFIEGKGTHVEDEVFWRADGTSFPVNYYSYPQYRDGEVIGAVVTFTDITERKLARNEIIKAKEQAEAANIAKSQFLASMSHEIRTPMNGIIGFLQLLENTGLNKEQLEFIQTIKSSTDTLLAVINDILDISKIEAGKLELECIPFDIRSTIETTVIPFATKASPRLELNMLIRSDIPQFVMGDPTKLRQVIGNLTNNALKFTDKGEVFIEVCLKKETDTAIELLFTIKDTGIGMSEAEINKLFQPFTQADASSTRKYGGTGLGLAICKSIVKKMGGEISVISEKGKGTTFNFTVTLNKAEDFEVPLAADYSVLKGKRVLIVDDHAMNRHIAKVYLQDAGCMVSESENASHALNELFRYPDESIYNVILVDYQMPGMSGFDMAAALKAINLTENIPLILITSVAIGGDAQQAKTNGFSGYLSKPYKRKELLDCVAMVLAGEEFDKADKSVFVTRHTAQEFHHNNKLKILLVEDNETNRMLFIKLLNKKGLSCDIAINGEEAVRACVKKNYDMIFMDCQMPVMDGYEATRQIRKAEGSNKPTVIIAMTAYAMQGDAEKCLKAGMDDYLSKPFSLEQLMKMLKKYGKATDNENTEIDSKDRFSEAVLTLMEESGFDKETCDEILTIFCEQTDRLIGEISNQFAKKDYEEAAILIHQLKGSASNVRAKEIAKYALEMEEAIKTSNNEILVGLLKEIERLSKDLRDKGKGGYPNDHREYNDC